MMQCVQQRRSDPIGSFAIHFRSSCGKKVRLRTRSEPLDRREHALVVQLDRVAQQLAQVLYVISKLGVARLLECLCSLSGQEARNWQRDEARRRRRRSTQHESRQHSGRGVQIGSDLSRHRSDRAAAK